MVESKFRDTCFHSSVYYKVHPNFSNLSKRKLIKKIAELLLRSTESVIIGDLKLPEISPSWREPQLDPSPKEQSTASGLTWHDWQILCNTS